MGDLTQEDLKRILDYDAGTGLFTWKEKISRKNVVGREAGCLCVKTGYVFIRIFGVLYRAHRLAWLYVYGRWPKHEIDHINGDRSDNRISNLRDVTSSENGRNTARRRDNTSGHTGVWFDKQRGKWRPYIKNQDGKRVWLRRFKDKEKAAEARKEAEMDYGYSARHGMEEARWKS